MVAVVVWSCQPWKSFQFIKATDGEAPSCGCLLRSIYRSPDSCLCFCSPHHSSLSQDFWTTRITPATGNIFSKALVPFGHKTCQCHLYYGYMIRLQTRVYNHQLSACSVGALIIGIIGIKESPFLSLQEHRTCSTNICFAFLLRYHSPQLHEQPTTKHRGTP